MREIGRSLLVCLIIFQIAYIPIIEYMEWESQNGLDSVAKEQLSNFMRKVGNGFGQLSKATLTQLYFD